LSTFGFSGIVLLILAIHAGGHARQDTRTGMAQDTPFGQATRMRVLDGYFAQAGAVDEQNAWEHVYRCLLWMNLGARLAHIYDSNHMQAGGVFHGRAVQFTGLLCAHWKITRKELPAQIDHLFRGCVAELRRRNVRPEGELDAETESELISAIESVLRAEGIAEPKALAVARRIDGLCRDFFTVGNKRKNALGEGFEDLLWILLQRTCRIPTDKIKLRTPVSQMPGFRRAPKPPKGAKRKREPHPDIAIVEGEVARFYGTVWRLC
jgi:hypothetical protein